MTRAEEIIEVALELFAEKGYDATSIQDITARVNIKKATFYSHFESKKELLLLIMKQQADHIIKNTHAVLKASSAKDVKELLFDVFDSQVRMNYNRNHLLFWKRAVLSQAGMSDEQLQTDIAGIMEGVNNAMRSALGSALQGAMTASNSNMSLECLSKCMFMFFVLLQGYLDWILVAGSPEPARVREVWECIWNGMGAGSHR